MATDAPTHCRCTQNGLADALVERDARLQARIARHPCYSEEAHHHYARMHVAVAPACNIQCHYCNRKYDCANESRPGVVSEVLTPEEALRKVLVIAGKIPQLTVVGIAGPGDPLANPQQTFRTFELLAEHAPDLKLCLSTNGLNLPDYIDRIKALGIDHVTVTINAIDPEIAAQIYPWIRWQRKRIYGKEAVKILLERQKEGLEALQKADILCKVNSVMIPGINDRHLLEVNQFIREKGAFIHNIMPLISDPAHGTYFGLHGQRGPTPQELKALQDQCAGNMRIMRHCRQCRADAIGLLGEDRSQEFPKAKVMTMPVTYDPEQRRRVQEQVERQRRELAALKAQLTTAPAAPTPKILVAVASKGGGLVNQHFGHAKEFLIYEVDGASVNFVGHRKVAQYCQGGYGEEATMEHILAAIADCQGVLCSKIGACPQEKLRQRGIEPFEDYDAIDVVARKFYSKFLQTQPEVCHALQNAE
ncbi:MAG: nitrogenase cofactor biosynthesis protein NifB [Gloeomargarita sp. GMQP_bins_120]